MPEAIDARLAAMRLDDSDGKPVILGDLWRERPAAILWIRHFG